MTQRPDERYPLTWPAGWPRTPPHARSHSPFAAVTTDRAMRDLMHELQLLGASKVIVSSNLKLRQDGMPYSQQPRNDDEGIAVYFVRKGVEMALACDKFAKREANLRAIAKTIDAIRGIERWGSSDMMERAFTGFAALPAPFDWRAVLGFGRDERVTRADVDAEYRRRAAELHPDRHGDAFHDRMADLNAARDAGREAVSS